MTSIDTGPSIETTGDGQHVPTVVIGAGQTGLATAYHLGSAGHDCLVVHADARVGDQWRQHRYESLRLNTPAQWDGLPGTPFPAPRGSFPTGAQMADYLESYVERHGIDVRHRTGVTRVERTDDGYVVTHRNGVIRADNVVVATGGEHHPRVPEVASQLDPGIRQLHSSDYRNPSQLLPGPVLVVGAGQSGADLALEVVRAGHPTWLSGKVKGEIPIDIEGRRARVAGPVLWFIANHVLTLRTPIGRKAQPAIRAGGAPLLRVKRAHLDEAGVTRVESRTTAVSDGRPCLEDGTMLDVANVLWCTGFRQDFAFIHPSVTGPDGWPTDRGGVVPDSPGLYFMGLLFQRGFYSMLVGGAGRDAAYIARHIVRTSRTRVAAG
jgi:putative flavoprotein involved in K+ transport